MLSAPAATPATRHGTFRCAFTPHGPPGRNVVRDQPGQPGPLRQRHHRDQPGPRHEIPRGGLVVTGRLVVRGCYEDTDDPECCTFVLGDMQAGSVITAGYLNLAAGRASGDSAQNWP